MYLKDNNLSLQAGLIDQLSLSFCQLLVLSGESDLVHWLETIGQYWEVVETSIRSAVKRVSPEKYGAFLEAGRNMEELYSRARRTEEGEALMKLLTDCTQNFSC